MEHFAAFYTFLKGNLSIIALAFLLVANALIIAYMFAKIKWFTNVHAGFENLYKKLREEIRFSVEPKFLQLSPELAVMTDLAVEIWRLGQRINNTASGIQENHKKGFENSMAKLNRCLEKFDLQIVDYTGQKFNAGLTVDVLSTEKDSSVTEAVVKATMEPTILFKNQVVKKAKVIVLQKQD